tara:strand:+ start:225 stop:809 length:585 start_codon:yes stop_codon:yes gene_type:complete
MNTTDDRILTIIDANNRIVYVDLSLIDEKNLEGARVFKLLFKMTKDNPFSNIKMYTDDNNNITLFKELGIMERQWNKLFTFLKYGRILSDPNCRGGFVIDMDSCLEISNKLGGIPEFDEYYKEIVFNKEIDENYNPRTTYEDVKGKYMWSGYEKSTNWQAYHRWMDTYDVKSWSLTKIEDKGNGVKYYWYRKKN